MSCGDVQDAQDSLIGAILTNAKTWQINRDGVLTLTDSSGRILTATR